MRRVTVISENWTGSRPDWLSKVSVTYVIDMAWRLDVPEKMTSVIASARRLL